MHSTIELPEAVVQKLKIEARKSRKSVGAFIADMLEDFADTKAAEAAYRKHLKSGAKSVSITEAKKKLGLEH